MEFNLFQVDAFTSLPFKGNPAAVYLLKEERDDQWMQNFASEMNLAETAFLQNEDKDWSLRWFTPELEVNLCGHATLASAHILYTEGYVERNSPIRFSSRSGVLLARTSGKEIILDFPAESCTECDAPTVLPSVVKTSYRFCGRNRMDYLVELENEQAVLECKPDIALLADLGGRCVVITSRADRIPNADFVSRSFCPNAGVAEDPVTGSAHCMLGPYWRTKLGKSKLVGYQASKRGGYVGVNLLGDRVELSGEAVTIFRGRIGI
jgi:predicted PhzF superfamily epimerase YddE/YHI9